MIEINYPKEIMSLSCKQKRITIKTKKDYYSFINANITSSNMFKTVYNYTEFGNDYPFRPDYDSAIVNVLWFDFDLETILDDKTVIRNDCYGNMKKLHQWCLKHDLIHECRYTGSGFDITIMTLRDCFITNKKDCIKNAVIELCNNLEIESDAKTLGDIARVNRITNTFNFKPKAKRYCIPLTQEMIDSGHKKIRKLAHKQQFHSIIFGSKELDIRKHDKKTTYDNDFIVEGNNSIKNIKMDDLSTSVPICIKHLLSKGNPSYDERRPIIVGLRELAFTENETKQILHKYLDSKKFYHCVIEEGQLHHLYKSSKVIFPKQMEMLKFKSCPHKLGEYCENSKRGCLNYSRVK